MVKTICFAVKCECNAVWAMEIRQKDVVPIMEDWCAATRLMNLASAQSCDAFIAEHERLKHRFELAIIEVGPVDVAVDR